MIRQGSGIHFDPEMVEASVAITHDFKEIAERYIDSHETAA